LNRGIEEDEKGIGPTSEVEEEESIIDYILVNEKLREEVERLEIGNQESDYHLIIVWLKEEKEGETGKRESQKSIKDLEK